MDNWLSSIAAFFTVDNAKAFAGWGAALVAVVGHFLEKRLQLKKQAAEMAAAAKAKDAELQGKVGAVAELFGARFSISNWKIVLSLGADGSGSVVRSVTGIKTNVILTDVRVPYKMRTTQGALGPFVLKPAPGSPMAFHAVIFGNPKPDSVDADIVLAGSLTPQSKSVGFEASQAILAKAFCTSEEEVVEAMAADRFKYEFFGTSVVLPVDDLVVEVEFPDASFGSRSFPVVFYGEEEFRNLEEEAKLQSGAFQFIGKTGRLRVTNPIRGHHYAVAWMPPPGSSVKTT